MSHHNQVHHFSHFIAFQITDRKIIDHIQKVQDHFIEKMPSVREVVVPRSRAHVPLFVVDIEKERLHAAVKAFQHVIHEKHRMQMQGDPINLKVSGVDWISSGGEDRIVYAKVDPEKKKKSDIVALVNDIKDEFRRLDLHVDRSTMPFLHVSLINTQRDHHHHHGGGGGASEVGGDDQPPSYEDAAAPGELLRPSDIGHDFLADVESVNFGVQKVTSIQLLSKSQLDHNGYYICEAEVII